MSNNTQTKKMEMVRQYVESATLSLQEAKIILEELSGDHSGQEASHKARQAGAILATNDGSKIIEGVFDGQNMMGPDGKQYSMPANYASKSKLVEGDMLKLTILPNGSFIYKQIGPVERKRLRGKLIKDQETGEFRIIADERSYRTLTASITYFKGQVNDDVVILVPRDKVASWASVENIIHSDESQSLYADTAEIRPDNELPAGDHVSLPSPVSDTAHQISLTEETEEEESNVEEESEEGEEVKESEEVEEEEVDESEKESKVPSTADALTSSKPQISTSAASSSLQFDDDKDEFEAI